MSFGDMGQNCRIRREPASHRPAARSGNKHISQNVVDATDAYALIVTDERDYPDCRASRHRTQ